MTPEPGTIRASATSPSNPAPLILLCLLVLAGCLATIGCGKAGKQPAEPAPPSTSRPTPAGGTAAARRPSIVMIFTDDQRYDTMGCTGHPHIETPHLDRMAREGALFEQAFVITSLCAPSRATVLSGLYTHLTGVSSNLMDLDHTGITVLPEYLKEAGYDTAFIGKYHIGTNRGMPQPGFDHWAAFRSQGKYFDPVINVNGTLTEFSGHSTDILTDMAVDWIRKRGEAPFFLILSVKNPHDPYEPPPRHAELYDDVAIELPDTFDLPPPSFIERPIKPPGQIENIIRGYWRLIPSIDDAVGRIYAALGEVGVLDDTLLIFFSDNGYLLGEHGLVGKMLPYEPSIHVPMMIRYPPLVPPGSRIGEQVLNLDLPPTVLEVAGIDVPERMQGASLVPLMAGEARQWRQDWLMVGSYKTRKGPYFMALRNDDWKYIRFRRGLQQELLFDRRADPEEVTDLSAAPEHAAVLEAMRARMQELMAEMEAPERWWGPGEK